MRDAIGADAEEHHMGEGHDAGVAEQHVVGGDEQRVDADLRRDIERLAPGNRNGAKASASTTTISNAVSARPRGAIARQDHHRPLTG